MTTDYYEVLGVSTTAEYDQIKRQYRSLVREYHPDVAVDKDTAHAKMQLILEAWNILSNPVERSRYDKVRTGEASSAPKTTYAPGPEAPDKASHQARTAENIRNIPKAGGTNMRTRMLTEVFEANRLFHVEKKIPQAVAKCKKITDFDPTTAEAWALWGDIYLSQGQKAEALNVYEQAVRQQPNNNLYRQKFETLKAEDEEAFVRSNGRPSSSSGFDRGASVGSVAARLNKKMEFNASDARSGGKAKGCGAGVIIFASGFSAAAYIIARFLV